MRIIGDWTVIKMANSINFSFDAPLTKVTDDEVHEVTPPAQDTDDNEYVCGNTGNAHPYANTGRDQDRSRSDEYVAAQGCSRYVS